MVEVAETHEESIGGLVRRLEQNYISGSTHPSKYVSMSLSEDVNKIYAYLESKHVSGDLDSLGREKPFFNIVLASRNIWWRSTDIDRKNIKIKPTKSSHVLLAFLATIHLQDWMRRENFGQFLNDWGINQAGFNETILKFVEQDGRLIPNVTPWNRIICDIIDFDNNPKIELLELTEAQLYKNKSYDQKKVKSLCDALRGRESLERQRKDTNNNNYIKLYELHGEFSQAFYNSAKGLETKDGDDDIFFQQMHVLSFVQGEKDDEYDDFTLYSGKETDPYMLTALLPEVDGSIALRGAVKTLFEAQWMVNHSMKSIKDQLDLASKLIFQTSDGNFVGQNALSAIETGDILIHSINQPLTQVANSSHDTTQIQNFSTVWKQLGNELAGISEAMLGNNPPSGTAWRQTQAILQESHSLFEIMTENRGLDIEKMLRRFIIPFLKKKMDNSKEIGAVLEAHDIQKIDAKYITNTAIRQVNSKVKNKILGGGTVTPQEQAQMTNGAQQMIQGQLSDQGNQRFFKPSDVDNKTWKELLKDLEWEVEVDVTGEDGPDKDDMATLVTTLQTISSNPRVLMDPNAKLIFNKILTLTGAISPLELADAQPFSVPPSKKLTETMDYKDVPEDVKRQIEEQAGLQPSQTTPSSMPTPGGGGALPVKQ